jgi:hypothetical protein
VVTTMNPFFAGVRLFDEASRGYVSRGLRRGRLESTGQAGERGCLGPRAKTGNSIKLRGVRQVEMRVGNEGGEGPVYWLNWLIRQLGRLGADGEIEGGRRDLCIQLQQTDTGIGRDWFFWRQRSAREQS